MGMVLLTEDEVVARLKNLTDSQTTLAREVHCSKAFVNQVLTQRRTRPPQRMLNLINVERRLVYVEKGTFPDEYKLPGEK